MTDILVLIERLITLGAFTASVIGFFYVVYWIWATVGVKLLSNRNLTLKDALQPIGSLVAFAAIIMIALPLLAQALRSSYNNSSVHLLGLGQDIVRDMNILRDGGYTKTTVDSVPSGGMPEISLYIEHTVQNTETVTSISNIYGVPSGQIMAYNNLATQIVPAGTVLRIPTKSESRMNLDLFDPSLSPAPTPSFGN